jgi:hypothetical protein
MNVSLTGADVIVINGRVFHDLADGEAVNIAFDNDLAAMKVAKDGNGIYALNLTGIVSHVTARVLRASADDRFMNSLMQQMMNDFSGFNLMSGSFTKRVGDGAGNVAGDVYQMSGGIIKKMPGAMTSAEGNTDQSVTVWEMLFRNQRSIQ